MCQRLTKGEDNQKWEFVALALEWAITATGRKAPYEQAAIICGVSAQTLKSALSRKRNQMLHGGIEVPPPLPKNATERKLQNENIEALTVEIQEEAAETRTRKDDPRSRKAQSYGPRRSHRLKRKRLERKPSPSDEESYWSAADDESDSPQKKQRRDETVYTEITQPLEGQLAEGHQSNDADWEASFFDSFIEPSAYY